MSGTKDWLKSGFGKAIAYFLQGLLLIAPIFITLWAIVSFFVFFDTRINDLFEYLFHRRYVGIGLLSVLGLITVIGFVGSLVFVQPFLHLTDLILEKTPVVKDIYTSLKDFFGAFISNKKKFNTPVMFEFGKGSGVFKLGFITQEDLGDLNIKDRAYPFNYSD